MKENRKAKSPCEKQNEEKFRTANKKSGEIFGGVLKGRDKFWSLAQRISRLLSRKD